MLPRRSITLSSQDILEGYAAALGAAIAYLRHIADDHEGNDAPQIAEEGLKRIAKISPSAAALVAQVIAAEDVAARAKERQS